jgi:hypothetical protein
MVAMFMAIYAQECFPTFSETMKLHFKNKTEVGTWKLNQGFKSNVVRIWQKIEEYEEIPFARLMMYLVIDKTSVMTIAFVTLALLSFLLYLIDNFLLYDVYIDPNSIVLLMISFFSTFGYL